MGLLAFWRRLWNRKRERVADADPKLSEPCDWCEKVTRTTVNEIWCNADPEGRLVRLCANCCAGCAGG